MSPFHSVIEVQDLVKDYPGVRALDGITFQVYRGEIFGLLGPNGAGKSTCLSIIEGVRPPDAGRVTLLGLDVAREAARVKQLIGVQLQKTSLLPDLGALEQVLLLARLYGRQLNQAGALALLDQVGLADKAGARPAALSGGQQQRLALALALVNDPQILFLDEPTAGLDPQSRRLLWDLLEQFRDDGRTIVLTTHYMEEAEALCHRIGIIDRGRLLALDTPGALVNRLSSLSTITTAARIAPEAAAAFAGVRQVQHEGALLRLRSADVPATIGHLLAYAGSEALSLHDLHIRQPSLEDVFLELTGRSLRESALQEK